jgi:predicted O-methyltransferase YrrM
MIRRLWSAAVMAVAAPAVLGAQPAGVRSDVPRDVAAVLRDIKAADTEMMAVSEEDGRFLRVMAVARGATSALEIGGASGYSAIWIGMAMRETGGRLTTIEFDPRRARELGDNVRRAGLADIVTVVHGDAFKVIPALQGSFDFVFLDAWKPDYKRFFELVLPRLQIGGVFLAHNTVNKRDEMEDFLEAVQTSPSVWTTLVSPSHEGMSVSVKR